MQAARVITHMATLVVLSSSAALSLYAYSQGIADEEFYHWAGPALAVLPLLDYCQTFFLRCGVACRPHMAARNAPAFWREASWALKRRGSIVLSIGVMLPMFISYSAGRFTAVTCGLPFSFIFLAMSYHIHAELDSSIAERLESNYARVV